MKPVIQGSTPSKIDAVVGDQPDVYLPCPFHDLTQPSDIPLDDLQVKCTYIVTDDRSVQHEASPADDNELVDDLQNIFGKEAELELDVINIGMGFDIQALMLYSLCSRLRHRGAQVS